MMPRVKKLYILSISWYYEIKILCFVIDQIQSYVDIHIFTKSA